VELVPFELEQELALLEPLAPILEGHPLATVPDDDAACAVVPVWDDPLEVAVLERVVLDLHGEPLVVHVVRRPLGHGPRPQHAVHLDPQIPVQLPSGVLVHDEEPSRHGRDGPDRLG
jgi:hypothetical protein